MAESLPLFGPAGCCEMFAAQGGRHTKDVFAFLEKTELDAFEYQGGNGIRAGRAALEEIGRAASDHGIRMSLHAPYFISLSGTEEETRLKSLDYIASSIEAAEYLGADTIVIHTGSAAKISRETAMELAGDTLARAVEKFGRDGPALGLETMGKVNQLGTPEEVIRLCGISERLVPVFDFGHINARSCGEALRSKDDFVRLLDGAARQYGRDMSRLHCHFSMIEWTGAGEKRHHNFSDGTEYGPDYRQMLDAVRELGMSPRIICESAGHMSEDSITMKKYFYGKDRIL